jgi:hypothetical protein
MVDNCRVRGTINFYSFVVIKATVGIFNTLAGKVTRIYRCCIVYAGTGPLVNVPVPLNANLWWLAASSF